MNKVLEQLVQLSKRMLNHCEHNEWESVFELEKMRLSLMDQLVNSHELIDEPHIINSIKTLLENYKITAHLIKEEELIKKQEIIKIKKHSKGNLMYKNV